MGKYILFAGVNGAGKTTMYNVFDGLSNMERVNVDEIVRTIGRWDNLEDVMKAGRIAVKRQQELLTAGNDFNQETTLCGRSILKAIKEAKELGFSIYVYYIGLNDVEIAIERVRERIKNGGHGIPEMDIVRRYEESLVNLRSIVRLCDKIELFDNTVEFTRIAVYQNGQWVLKTKDIPDWAQKVIEHDQKND